MSRHEVVDTVGNGHSVKDQLTGMKNEQLWHEMDALNKQLSKLGVDEPISGIIYWGMMHGCEYEDDHERGKPAKPTFGNCFMALLNDQPELRNLSINKFKELGGLVARVSMTFEVLFERTGPFEWPPAFTQAPQ